MTYPAWLTCQSDHAVIRVHALPGAKRTEMTGLHGDALRIRVQAPPVEGAANKALIAFLARSLGVRQRDVQLLAGDRSREKRFAIFHIEASLLIGKVNALQPDQR